MDWFLYDRDLRQEKLNPFRDTVEINKKIIFKGIKTISGQYFYKKSIKLLYIKPQATLL